MTHSLPSKLAALLATAGVAAFSTFGAVGAAQAQVFGQQEVDQSKFVLVASPYGNGAYGLLIIEQVSDQRPCWSESGSNPVIVDPLLLQFDFAGICARSTDSNSFSIRMAGRDFARIYDLRIERQNNDLVLVGANPSDRDAPKITLGKTNGIPTSGFAKLQLNPEWRLSKRVLNGKALGHVYLTSDTLAAGVSLPSAFPDTSTHWAKRYIDALAAQNIISGFPEDGSFRPEDPVTRVQFAAIVNKAFASAPTQRPTASFQDVATNFWGLQPIQAAYQKGFMSGYPEGTFKPDQRIPRLQVLVALSSGLGLPNVDPGVLSVFQDAAQIPGWAAGTVAAATDKQFVVNYPQVKQLNPNREATRAEVAAFVYQALASMGQMPAITSPYVVVVNPQPGAPPAQAPSGVLQAPTASPSPAIAPPTNSQTPGSPQAPVQPSSGQPASEPVQPSSGASQPPSGSSPSPASPQVPQSTPQNAP